MLRTGGLARILPTVMIVNANQRSRVVEKLQGHLKSLRGRRITVLGLSFKPGTDNLRDALSVDILSRLTAGGALVTAHDPVVRQLLGVPGVRLVESVEHAAARAHALVLLTEWPEYLGLDVGELRSARKGNAFIDGRKTFEPTSVAAAGFVYEGMGRTARRDHVEVWS